MYAQLEHTLHYINIIAIKLMFNNYIEFLSEITLPDMLEFKLLIWFYVNVSTCKIKRCIVF